MVRVHLLDCLAVIPYVTGLGSGRRQRTGFPGIPSRVARPGIQCRLLDSNHKKRPFSGRRCGPSV